jgi:hypothetical protein
MANRYAISVHNMYVVMGNVLKTLGLSLWRRGSRNISDIENTELIEKSRRTKRSRIRNCAKLERIWNARLRWNTRNFDSFLMTDDVHLLRLRAGY